MSAPLVMIQFSVSNPKRIPQSVAPLMPETLDESAERRERSVSGEYFNLLVDKTRRCDVAELAHNLNDNDYYLVSVVRQDRRDRRDPRKTYCALRYFFAKGEQASAKLEAVRSLYAGVEDDLLSLLTDAFWQVRAYRNVREDGAELLSINLDGLEPRYRNDGSPVTQWRKDDQNRRVGDAPEPIWPEAALKVVGDDLKVSLEKL